MDGTLLIIRKIPNHLKWRLTWGIAEWTMPVFGILAICVGLLLLIPKTFFAGNLLNAFTLVFVMALALRAGHVRLALIEIPFFINFTATNLA